ncbi:MFS-type transporter SLC18B1-like isoform X2 [Biomphalaria glabrata]|uniref:MFS-type transporter SLC18B1-like isoform X2 n=1 Tax=Biomphalaria glabrata TaxID=6526 RepID=A0A9W2ZAG3_BIOGL|nr:MFS-type transporter SLC18B1-like isoform X2 [Biomphalaria glabrata]
MSSNPHPYLSSSSFNFTKSGSCTTQGRRQSLQRHSISNETRRNSNGNGNKLILETGDTALLDEKTENSGGGEVMKFSQMPHRSKYTLFMLAVANFGAGCAYSLPAPFFPREATKKGVSSTLIGLVFSCYQLVIVLTSPLIGNFITQIGAKFTYVIGIMLAGVCAILFGFLGQGPPGTPFIVMSFLVRAVEAIGVAAFSTASFAIVSNEFPYHIGSVFATLETCVGIGLMIGPTIGGALYEFGLSTLLVGLFFIICPGLHAILAPVWGYISDRKDIQSPLLIFGNLVGTIAFLSVGPTPLLPFLPRDLWVVAVGLILFGLTIGCSIVPTMKCLVIGARELGFPDNLSTFGMVSGLFNATYCLGAFIGPTVGGALIEEVGFAYGSTIIAALFFFVMIVTSVYFGVRRLRHKSDIQMTKYTDLSSTPQQTLWSNEDTEITERSPLLLDKSQKETRLTFESSFSSASFSQEI